MTSAVSHAEAAGVTNSVRPIKDVASFCYSRLLYSAESSTSSIGAFSGVHSWNAELLKRDKLSLDLFWIKDKSLTDSDSLPAPDIIAAEIVDELEEALEQFAKISRRLRTPRQETDGALTTALN